MQERLVPHFDERLILDYESPVTRDHELELQAGQIAPFALSVDEWRARMGEAPLDGDKGTIHMVSATVMPMTLEQMAGHYEAQPVADPAADPDEDGGDDGDTAERAIMLRRAEAGDAEALAACVKAGDDEAVAEFAKDADDTDPAPTQLMERQVPRYRRAQERAWLTLAVRADDEALVGAVARADEEGMVAALGGDAAFVQALVAPLQAYGRPAFLRGAQLALETLPPATTREPLRISLDGVNPEAVRWAERQAARLVRNVNADTRLAIRALIVAAEARGIAPRDVARRIRNIVGLLPAQVEAVVRYEARLLEQGVAPATAAKRAQRYAEAQLRVRALRIARTELASATNHGQQALWQLAKLRGVLPADTRRVWIATHDDLLDRHICLPLDGETAGLDEPFPGGHMVPPAHPGCRCAVGIQSVPKR
jgi:hypothetical protein